MPFTLKHYRIAVLVPCACLIISSLISHRAFGQPGTWSFQLEATADLYSVKAVDENIGWAAGAGGVVLRTMNGGSTWESRGDTSMGIIYSIDAFDASTAWVASSTTETGGNTSIFRTTNGGGTWQKVYSLLAAGAFIDCLKMVDPLKGFAVGDPVNGKWVVLKTTDGGASWARLATEPTSIGDEIGFLNILSVVSATDLRFVSGASDTTRMHRSTDGGATWAWYPIPIPGGYYAQALKFNTPDIGVVGSSSRTLARTTNGGVTWSSFTLPGPGTWGLSGYGSTFFAANWYVVQASTDNGQTWAPSYQTNIGQLIAADFVNRSGSVRGWVMGVKAEEGIFYTNIVSYFEAPASVHGGEPEGRPGSMELFQNYPNPFNPSTTLGYTIAGTGHEALGTSWVRLSVYDVLGREVAVLVNETKEPGEYSVEWNAAGMTSGMYLYRLEVRPSNSGPMRNSESGGFVETKRLLLLR